MTDRWGIQHRYRDASGAARRLTAGTVARLRAAVGEPEASGPGVIVTRRTERRQVGRGVLTCEDGQTVEVAQRLPPDIPLGYHEFRAPGELARAVIVSPGHCHVPSRPAWGWTVQLHAARSRRSWGLGDLGDLGDLADWSGRVHRAGFILVSPLHAVAPSGLQQASPYFPATRRFRNPLFLRIEAVPGAADLGDELARLGAAGRALNASRLIDRDAVWLLKRPALEMIWRRTAGGDGFRRWFDGAPSDVRRFATWCVLAERHGPAWRRWPSVYRHPSNPEVAAVLHRDDDRIRFHAWLQWLLERQMESIGTDVGVVHDLAVGVDPDGFDAWEWQDIFAAGVTIGAPPDVFNTRGQDWRVLPFVPWRLRQVNYRPFIDTLRATLAHAGGVRIDHVLGLLRLWWVPEGLSPGAGGYVRYPVEDLLEIVALESHRAQATVVGEDLGTVDPRIRVLMADRGVLSYRVLWFEPKPPSTWPVRSLAVVTTHDLPTVAGLWSRRDLEVQSAMGLEPNAAATEAVRQRLADGAGLDAGASADAAVRGAYQLLAHSQALMRGASLEDAVGETQRPNIPGTDGRRPNWRLALAVPLDDLPDHPLACAIAEELARSVATRAPEGRLG